MTWIHFEKADFIERFYVFLQGNLLLTGDKDQLVMLLDQINTPFVRSNPSVLQGLLRIIPFLSFGELEKMRILVERFKPCCSFDKWAPVSSYRKTVVFPFMTVMISLNQVWRNLTLFLCHPRYDEEHSADDKVFLDCFCKIAAGIKNNSNGHQLKDLILQKGITQSALDYMKKHIPNAKKWVLWNEWPHKAFPPHICIWRVDSDFSPQSGRRCLEEVPLQTSSTLHPPTASWFGHSASSHTGTKYCNTLGPMEWNGNRVCKSISPDLMSCHSLSRFW